MASLKKTLALRTAQKVAPKVTSIAPGLTQSFVGEALQRAIAGVGPLPAAAAAADAQLAEQHGNVDKAIRELIENHVAYAGAEGLVTNLGGLITAAVVAPASITGLAVIQCRMVAGIVYLRGYDLDDPRVRNAILTAILGEDTVQAMVKRKQLPAPPMALATAPQHDPTLDRTVSTILAGELVGRVIGKRLATTVGKRVPLVGGAVGAAADAWSTYRVGRYAAREFRHLSAKL